MLQITPRALTLIRIGQEQANWRIRQSGTNAKPRALNRDRRRHLIETTTSILKTGFPTHFNFEGSCRHGVRRSLCLEGWKWSDADAAAADVVSAALNQIGATRPTWNQGQPWWTEEGATQVERSHCERCFRPIQQEAVAGRFCSTLCSKSATKERHRKSGEAMSQAAYWAAVAAQRPVPSPCHHCGTVFQPRNGEAKFCSYSCAHAAIRLRPSDVTCAQCGTRFSPKKNSDQRYCTHDCYAKGKANKRLAPRPCVVCKVDFCPRAPQAMYCTKLCQARFERSKKAAALPPKQCENCETYFRSERAAARFCGTSCSMISRNRAIRDAGLFQCEAAE